MPWRTLKKMMTDKYCLRGEIKKLEFEMWNLKVKGTDVVAYSQRFQELALMYDRMFPKEINKVERYVGGLPDTIHGSADNKRKYNDTTRNNHQQPNKRQNTGRAYATGNGDSGAYEGPRTLCTKCNYHHDSPCAPKCHKCNRFGHLSRDCRNPLNVNTRANQRGNVFFECGAHGHFKQEFPKLKNNNNRGNQVGNAKAQAKVYAVGKARANPDNNVVMGTFLLNNCYASILFDTGADGSFVSIAFSSGIVITPTALDHDYNVELADGIIYTTTTTSVTNAQLRAMIDQGVTDALAARDANRNDDDSHTSGTGRPVQVAGECTYPDFLKCQPLNFKGTEGVLGLKEIDKVERYVGGLPDTIHGSADNKRKYDDTTRNNHQQPNKRQNTGRASATGNGDRGAYEGPRTLCTK
nr:hypothetical protein [Tanacetum cinerariifolium]